jgi:hypothetical protein
MRNAWAYIILFTNLKAKGQLDTLRHKYEDNIKMDLKRVRRFQVVQGKIQWRLLRTR